MRCYHLLSLLIFIFISCHPRVDQTKVTKISLWEKNATCSFVFDLDADFTGILIQVQELGYDQVTGRDFSKEIIEKLHLEVSAKQGKKLYKKTFRPTDIKLSNLSTGAALVLADYDLSNFVRHVTKPLKMSVKVISPRNKALNYDSDVYVVFQK